eukprot:TRINITY_DN10479_c0_g1_i1.p1 TRINITY_DN10479_c0_g1~~TRINITY_DN10479_c0_g1_i1.p1  ORF type:complete len:375 (-),score=62.14 TRINITY_DN10479_c0_g1_i1:632-1651(-)
MKYDYRPPYILAYAVNPYPVEDAIYNCGSASVLVTSEKSNLPFADAWMYYSDYEDHNCDRIKEALPMEKTVPIVVESLEPPFCLDNYDAFPRDMIDIVSDYRFHCGIEPYQFMYAWRAANKRILERMMNPVVWDDKDDHIPVFWAARNCDTRSKRENYIRELSKYIGVNRYGDCLRNVTKDPERDRNSDIYEHPIEWSNKHYFYLAAENSNCDGYVTEKYYKTLLSGLVPIVDGPRDYSRFLPSDKSIIRMDDYTPEELAAYLKYLVSNRTAYMEYMPWKTDPNFKMKDDFIKLVSTPMKEGRHRRFCDILELVKQKKTAKSCFPQKEKACQHGKWSHL